MGLVLALGLSQLARLEGYRMELARIVGLLKDGGHCELRGVGEQARRACEVPP